MNNLSIIGRLVATPDLTQTQSGIPMTKFTLAVDRPYKKDGERQTDFLDCVAWRQTAEFICRFCSKGQRIGLTGSVQTDNYTDKDGNKRKSWSVQAQQVYFAESKRDGSGGKNNIGVERDEPPAGDFVPVANDDLPF